MAKKEKKEEAQRSTPGWMLTFGDMMMLLLTFFVLIVSFSSIQEAEFKEAIGSLRGALGILGRHEYLVSLGKIVIPEAKFAFMSRRLKQTTGEISKKLNFISEYENAQVIVDNRGLNIILPASVLFTSGDDTVQSEAYPLLRKIGAFLYELKKSSFLIEGHTDNRPISTVRFPSNWHLSSARAISIARYLHDQCGIDNQRLAVSGRGEYHPVAPNDSEENRKKNRRVVILIQTKAS